MSLHTANTMTDVYKDVVLSENRTGRPVLVHCEEPAKAVDGLRAIFWHQITKETGGDY